MSLFYKNRSLLTKSSVFGAKLSGLAKNQVRSIVMSYILENAQGDTGYRGKIDTKNPDNGKPGPDDYILIINPPLDKIPPEYRSLDAFAKSINFLKESNNNNSRHVSSVFYFGPGKIRVTVDQPL